MAKPNLKTAKALDKKYPRTPALPRFSGCRRCGEESCLCSDDELDAGGPA